MINDKMINDVDKVYIKMSEKGLFSRGYVSVQIWKCREQSVRPGSQFYYGMLRNRR